ELAWVRYGRDEVPVVAPVGSFATRAARRDLFQDDFNEQFLRRPGSSLVNALEVADNDVIDGGLVGGTSRGLADLANVVRRAQNGFVRSYALTMLAGIVAILGAVWVM